MEATPHEQLGVYFPWLSAAQDLYPDETLTLPSDIAPETATDRGEELRKYAVARVKQAISDGIVTHDPPTPRIAVQSYPIARLLISVVGDGALIDRFARAEARTSLAAIAGISPTAAGMNVGCQSAEAPARARLEITERWQPWGSAGTVDDGGLTPYLSADTTPPNDAPVIADLLSELDVAGLVRPSAVDIDIHPAGSEATETPIDWAAYMSVPEYLSTAVSDLDSEWSLARPVQHGYVVLTEQDLLNLALDCLTATIRSGLPYDISPDEIATLEPVIEPIRSEIGGHPPRETPGYVVACEQACDGCAGLPSAVNRGQLFSTLIYYRQQGYDRSEIATHLDMEQPLPDVCGSMLACIGDAGAPPTADGDVSADTTAASDAESETQTTGTQPAPEHETAPLYQSPPDGIYK